MPSPVKDRPGVLLRDPLRYTEDVVIVPPPLVPFLRYFDGGHEEADLATALLRATGEIGAGDYARGLADSLRRSGFLEDDELERRRQTCHRAFADAPCREASQAGVAYPRDGAELASTLRGYLGEAGPDEAASPPPGVFAVVAPHVSLEGGWRSYASAYRALPRGAAEQTVVVLGTSHYGAPERFGLTRKPYRTPLGETSVDPAVVDHLMAAGGAAVEAEDYCHAVEHAIEFQVLFLQHLLGPTVRVVPVLCGPFAEATHGGRPEDDAGVARFLGGLAELASAGASAPLWVLGVDMAHVGRRYGDDLVAEAGRGPLEDVEERDRRRIAALEAGDADAFWEQVQEEGDDLRWCGASALYAFLRAAASPRGTLLRYEQWNIDPASVVSFGALAYGAPSVARDTEGDT
jgi:AmmeMemoRadiSam system protein B